MVVEECRIWMDDVTGYHNRCEEWRHNQTLKAEMKARADKSLANWRQRKCHEFVPLPEMVVCL